MRINADNLKALIAESGVSYEDLGKSLPGIADTEKGVRLAARAVRNWSMGKDHPRARSSDVSALASALNVEPSAIAKYTSQFRWARSSDQKAGLIVDMIRRRPVGEALDLLSFSPRRAATMVKKALDAAVADAEQNEANIENLVVTEARVDQGLIIKRFHPKDRGRAHPIQKKTCHIIVSVEEVA